MRIDFRKLKRDCEELIRTGQIDLARNCLLKIKNAHIPRELAMDFANFSRRTGLSSIGLMILQPIINPKVSSKNPSTAAEKTVYAALLVKLGLIEEAVRILSQVRNAHPDAALYMASAHMHEWNYAAAVPHLKRFIKQSAITPYQRAIGQVNLAASLISCNRLEEASDLLKTLLSETNQHGWTLLHRNALELSGQIAIQSRNWKHARELLAGARSEDSKNAVASLYVEKMSAILELEQVGANAKTLQALTAVRARARELKDWETVRDCDFRNAVATQDRALLIQVYFGTPHRSFRKRIQDMTKSWIEIPKKFTFDFEGGGNRYLDLQTGVESRFENPFHNTLDVSQDISHANPHDEVNLSKMQERLSGTLLGILRALASDSYRPQTIVSIFASVFHGENFYPNSSPNRTAQGIFRLRQWLHERQIPLEIAVDGAEYRLIGRGPYSLIKQAEFGAPLEKKDENNLFAISSLKNQVPYKAFSSQQAAECLSISSASAKRLLKWADENGRVIRTGNGRSTLYRFAA